jgi:hypothetical protein
MEAAWAWAVYLYTVPRPQSPRKRITKWGGAARNRG